MKNYTNVTPTFQLVFFTIVFLTLLSGITSFSLASHPNISHEQARIFETCNATWNMGIGAIFGLLGSKAANLLQSNEDHE